APRHAVRRRRSDASPTGRPFRDRPRHQARRAGCARQPLPQELGGLRRAAAAGDLLLPHPELRRALASLRFLVL
ncbi:unnamed protein product, partial [Ectocarpus fasciculatus]